MKRILLALTFVMTYSFGYTQQLGCTDSTASNYDMNAGGDDGSCIYCDLGQEVVTLEFFQTGDQDWTGSSFSLTSLENGTVEYFSLISDLAFAEDGYVWEDICLNAGCYQFQLFDVVNPSQLSYSLFIHYDQYAFSYSAMFDSMNFVLNEPSCDITGCQDPTAENYNPYAITDDGSCYYACDNPPVNDNCSGAIPLESAVPVVNSLCCALPDEPDLCSPEDQTPYGVWYRMNSGACDTFSFVLENLSGADISMTIYEDANGTGCSGIEEVACCPVVPEVCAGDLASFMTLIPDSEYYFFVYTTDGVNCGEHSFTVSCEIYGCTDPFNCYYDPEATLDDATCLFDCSCVETNNSCFVALSIEPGFTDSVSTYCLESFLPLDFVGCDLDYQPGVWYTLEGTGTPATLSSCGSIGPTRVDVFTTSTSDCAGAFSCAVDAITDEYITSENNVCTSDDSELQFNTVEGATYFVYLSSPQLVFMQFAYTTSVSGDFNGDDEVDTTDLLLFLGDMGCTDDCITDLNGDGIVNVLDLLLFLSYFG